MFSGSTFLTKQSLLASASYTTSGSHVKSYLTSHATDWASELVSGKNTGSCAFKAVTVKETAGSASSSLKSGCTYTSSDESVVTSAGQIKKAGFVIMTGNDGSQSVITVQAEPQQTVTDCLRQPGSDTLHQHIELTIIQQIVECLPHLLRLIRPDLIELF